MKTFKLNNFSLEKSIFLK